MSVIHQLPNFNSVHDVWKSDSIWQLNNKQLKDTVVPYMTAKKNDALQPLIYYVLRDASMNQLRGFLCKRFYQHLTFPRCCHKFISRSLAEHAGSVHGHLRASVPTACSVMLDIIWRYVELEKSFPREIDTLLAQKF